MSIRGITPIAHIFLGQDRFRVLAYSKNQLVNNISYAKVGLKIIHLHFKVNSFVKFPSEIKKTSYKAKLNSHKISN